jgi:hypothetical protein
MTVQVYLEVDNSSNVVVNTVMWGGGSEWIPPADSTMLVQVTTPAMVWELNTATPPIYVLTEVIGVGQIGFTWNGLVLTTNQPQPENPKPQPVTTGTTTA